ncbi:hypothetical protein DRO38_00895 [Candidatus Bathyarchaeota archaeon]|nr:MAG: hypothetical protein DRO38_00895 [Candidatus Bathyarchaeota archaeon]
MKLKKYLRRSVPIIFVLVVSWHIINFVLLPLSLEEELTTIRNLVIVVNEPNVENEIFLKSPVILENPSSETVRVSSIIVNFKCNGYYIGGYKRDFQNPIRVSSSKKHVEEVFITNNLLSNYVGEKVIIEIRVQVIVETDHLKDIPLNKVASFEILIPK